MHSPRSLCLKCRRPAAVCCCHLIAPQETRTRIVLLQHPKERNVAIGTARLASICLPQASLLVGLEWDNHPALQPHFEPDANTYVLYPGPESIDVSERVPDGPIQLLVIDGTWPMSRKVMALNPRLASLPRLCFTPPAPSEYRIRREPRAECVSTLEALVHVLGRLEADPERFQALMVPFRAMIDLQLDYEQRLHTPYRRLKKRQRSLPDLESRMPAVLRERPETVVGVTVEANAWPACGEERRPDELIYVQAERLATGERLECVVRPRRPLYPPTCERIGLPADALDTGLSLDDLQARWAAFLKPDDTLCSWTSFGLDLLQDAGCTLPTQTLKLRSVYADVLRGAPGPLDQLHQRLALPGWPAFGVGRASSAQAMLMALALRIIRTHRPTWLPDGSPHCPTDWSDEVPLEAILRWTDQDRQAASEARRAARMADRSARLPGDE